MEPPVPAGAYVVPIPDYEMLMLPVLKLAAKAEVTVKECIDQLAKSFKLTDAEREQLLPSGKQTTFSNRVHWAKTYLVQAGLLKLTRRGHIQATERGMSVLARE